MQGNKIIKKGIAFIPFFIPRIVANQVVADLICFGQL